MPETPPPVEDKDPVVTQSLSGFLLVSSLLLVLSLLWAVYDEIYGQRPWKAIQRRFIQQYTAFLTKVKPKQAAAEKTVRQSEEYRKLEQAVLDAEKVIAPQLKEIDREVSEVITPRLAAITDPFALIRSEISALVYKLEVASSQRAKESLSKEIEEVKARSVRLALPSSQGDGKIQRVSLNFTQIEEDFNRLQARKAELAARRGEIVRPVGELRAKLDAYMTENMAGLTETQIEGLLNKMKISNIEIKQIHVKAVDLVDRCESCHLGIREPLTLTKADMGGQAAFISHPSKELLRIHDPENFGCTPCHNGNGTATTSVRKAHGRYKHWLWPLYGKENIQAGCHQCHASDLVLEHASVLNQGKEIFRGKGCVGCHRFEGFDAEAEAMTQNRLAIRRMENERKELEKKHREEHQGC